MTSVFIVSLVVEALVKCTAAGKLTQAKCKFFVDVICSLFFQTCLKNTVLNEYLIDGDVEGLLKTRSAKMLKLSMKRNSDDAEIISNGC